MDRVPRARSLAVRLPLFIGGLILAGVALGAVLTYRSVQATSVALSAQRLASLTNEFRQMLATSADQYRSRIRAFADTAPLRDFLAHPDPRTRAAALEALRPNPGLRITAQELRAPTGGPILGTGDTTVRRAAVAGTLAREAIGRDTALVGPLVVMGDSVLVASAAPVRAGGRRVAALVQWTNVTSTAAARQQLNAVIGTGSRLSIGGRDGGEWTDLVGRVPAPPIPAESLTGSVRDLTRPGTGPGLAVAREVPGTGWIVLVEMSRAAAQAGAVRYVKRLALITVVLLLIVLAGTWYATRALTRPLEELTRAAEAVAGGRLDTHVPDGRTDEIGRLAAAFDVMVANVRRAHDELEHRVEERTRELQERNEALEAFGYSLAHDLRAPLRAIDGFSRALLEDYGHQLDATGHHYARLLAGGAQTMDRMILDLLAYSRVTRTDITPGPVELAEAVAAAEVQVRGDLAARGARLRVAPDLPTVQAHAPTLIQVIANLLGNAAKFVPADRIPEIRVHATALAGRVRLWVEDNGIGIAPKYHERIFRVFDRLHGADEYPGTGIGLAIVRKGVERMGGKVGVESAEGEGSRFYVELEELRA